MLSNLLTHEFFHFTAMEIIKFIVFYIFVPLIVLAFVFFRHKFCLILQTLSEVKNKLDQRKVKIEFDRIFDHEDLNNIDKIYIKNALLTAKSKNETEKRNAIEQLSQYSTDEVFNGLIKLLACEDKDVFKYIIIQALGYVVQKRIQLTTKNH